MRLIGRGEPSDVTFEANADLSAARFTLVKPVMGEATGPQARLDPCGAAEGGWILQNNPARYLGGRIRRSGYSKLKVDGSGTAISVGDKLTSNAGGLGVKATSGQAYSAIAFEASDGDGDIIEVLVEHGTA